VSSSSSSSSQSDLIVIASLLVFALSEVRLIALGTVANIGLLYQPEMIDDGDYGVTGGMKIGREQYSEKPCPSATLSTRNPI
jgi:hypothetical protein